MSEIKAQVTGDPSGHSGGAMSSAGAGLRLGLRLLAIGPMLILLVLIAVLGAFSPHFLSGRNIANILAQTAVIAIVAMGQQLVILTRGIDLSVGSNLALLPVVGGAGVPGGRTAPCR